ncbi:MAG: Glucosylglycerate phosphorylase [Phycisphaerae bacterium]|nr:Glucosylglycerate phosphorylase [Phycisphaerae bacterium]
MEPRLRDRIARRLAFVYGRPAARDTLPGVEALVDRYCALPPRPRGWSQADALLIAYAHSVAGDGPPLADLHRFLAGHVGDLFTFVHLLPFYPYTSDDGFAVTDYRAVDPAVGDWSDIERLAGDYRLVFDAVINHASASSVYMQRYCAGESAARDFFIALPPDTDTSSVLRTRNLPLLHCYETASGPRWLWTTFGPDQVDLNFANPDVLLEILGVLLGYAARGASMLRLDAIPYLWKQLGTSCAHLPQTHELIRLIRDVLDAAAPWVLLLTETNVPHRENVVYFGDRGDEAQMIYNFALPPLILHALVRGDARTLAAWAAGIERIDGPATYLNITATHDGIGMRPTEGILPESERAMLCDLARRHGGDVTGKRNADGSVSPYELNLNYFDAVNDPAAAEPEALQIDRFCCSQAIPMCLLGLPGVYIHSLVGSRNDLEGVRRTGRARSINRATLHAGELARALADPGSLRARVLARMARMLAVRRRQAAFHPDAAQQVLDLGPSVFAVRRTDEASGQSILALHNMTAGPQRVDAPVAAGTIDLLSDQRVERPHLELAPYQVRWLLTGM